MNRVSRWSSLGSHGNRFAWPRGLTVLDVLLVLATILINIVILGPLILEARESDRSNRCKMNMQQICVAIHQYNDLHGALPPGFELNLNGPYTGWSWNQKILPQLGHPDLAARFSGVKSEGIAAVRDQADLAQDIPLLRCPSNPVEERLQNTHVVLTPVVEGTVAAASENWSRVFPRTNYFGNAGYLYVTFHGIQYNTAGNPTIIWPLSNAGSIGHRGTSKSVANWYCDQRQFGGSFGQNSHITFGHFCDGTSNSLMIGERYSPLTSNMETRPVTGHGTWIAVPDCTQAQGVAMALGDAAIRINAGMPRRNPTTGFGSMHEGGAYFGLGDGAVRFLSQNIDLEIYRKLSIICDANR